MGCVVKGRGGPGKGISAEVHDGAKRDMRL